MQNVLHLPELRRIVFRRIHNFDKAGDDGDIQLGGKKVRAALRRARLAVVEPHFLLRVEEHSPLPQHQLFLEHGEKVSREIARLGGNRNCVCIIHQKTDDAGHGKISRLADDIEPPPAECIGQMADDRVLNRTEMVAGNQHAAEILRNLFKPDNLGILVDHARRDLRHCDGNCGFQFEGQALTVFKIGVRDVPILLGAEHRVAKLHFAVEIAVFRAGANVFNDRAAVVPEYHSRILTPFSFILRKVISFSGISMPRCASFSRHALSDAFFASSYAAL